MAYCTDDGIEMSIVCNHDDDICYTCPTCDDHWAYVFGRYEYTLDFLCPVHTWCHRCEEKENEDGNYAMPPLP